MMKRLPVIGAVVLLLHMFGPNDVRAQRMFLGGGVGAASVPRAQNPLCNSARRLNGADLTAQAGVAVKQFRLAANYDFVFSGSASVADCVPRTGIVVDSLFAEAGTETSSLSAEAWYHMHPMLGAGASIGFLPGHDSWFWGAGLSAQYRWLRAEMFARRYHASFEEITRDYDPPVRELNRSSHTEGSWGWTVRLLLITH
jgi:hypothetical protein